MITEVKVKYFKLTFLFPFHFYRHSGMQHLSPVLEHFCTGLGPFSGTRLLTALKKHCSKVKNNAPCTSILLAVKRDLHYARPHCLRRRWVHLARPERRRQKGIPYNLTSPLL